MRNKRPVIAAGAVVAVAAAATWYLIWGPDGDLPDTPSRTADVKEVYAFDDVAQLAATSDLVIEATVTEVIAVEPKDPGEDDTGGDIERRVRLRIDEPLYQRTGSGTPDTVLVAEGFWGPDREGVAVGAMDWTRPGDTGYYFLSRSDSGAPYGYVSPSYGRVMVADGTAHLGESSGLEPEEDGPWAGSKADFSDLDGIESIIDEAVADAASGKTEPAERQLARRPVPGAVRGRWP